MRPDSESDPARVLPVGRRRLSSGMAKGQHLSKYQEGIVRRYYEHADSRVATTLQEILSDLYLAEGKQKDKLWARAAEWLAKAGFEPAKVERAVKDKDIQALGRIINEIAGPQKKAR